ncbi:telomere zinc finger-associated protein [Nilaparvata lugens]|uniref:telomere zinc finger-associated protein n=1 Tax=Nilaparvata lugens TaxID=108931 RepID=UPI00193E64C6|nr:telomere zinc finger-associated protein [Nilaparvata lugens]
MYSLYRAWLLRESSPPDVVVCVGAGSQTHQFAGHRVVLSAHSGYLKSMLADESDRRQLIVPNVSAEVFAPLLTFMYTGYLELTPDNIYGVLLATHLLHMPRALDLCRSYLLQHQPQPPPPTLVKPIPSRKSLLPVLFPPPPTGVYWPPPPPPYQPLPALPDEYRSVFPLTMSAEQQPPAQPSPPAIPSTSAVVASTSVAQPPVSPTPSQSSDSSNQVTVTVTPGPDARKQRLNSTPTNSTDSKVIVDIACCDGPVRFHRVLNQNYGRESQEAEPEQDTESTSATDKSGPVFTCRYCDHTFKSHYCYQKHARRHINPVSLTPDTQPEQPLTSPPQANPKQQVRLLDMNVQYYPCKTCGSKFPSYYFVHKHRKMCHPNEEASSTATAVTSDNSRSSCVAPAP